MAFIVRILNALTKYRVSKCPGVNISALSKVNFRAIVHRPTSQLIIGKGSIVNGSLISDREGSIIKIGENTFIDRSMIVSAERIEIGDDVLIAGGCYIVDHNSHSLSWEKRRHDVKNWFEGKKDWANVNRAKVVVKNRAWIGFNCIVLKGVTIGEGAIVGAGSVVTKDVPDYTVVVGNPARVLREISANER